MTEQVSAVKPVKKYRDWLSRYAYAEIMGLITAYMGYYLGYMLWDSSPVFAAFLGAAAENIGYYGVICVRQYLHDRRYLQEERGIYGLRGILRTFFCLLIEFGPAELADTFFIRPFCIGAGVYFLGINLGLLIGKLASDLLFYIPVIFSYEIRKLLAQRKLTKKQASLLK